MRVVVLTISLLIEGSAILSVWPPSIAFANGPGQSTQLRGLGIGAKFGASQAIDDREVALMKSLGVSIVVWVPGEWSHNEQIRGQYVLDAETKRVISMLSAANIRMIVALFRKNDIYSNPLDPSAFAQYCAWMASALQGAPVAAYQIWNEPSNFDFRSYYGGSWNGNGDSPWVDKFAELMHQSTQAIKRVDPRATVIASFDGPASVYAMRRDSGDFYGLDGLSLHPYSFTLPPEQVPYGGTAMFVRDGVSIADSDGALESTLRIQAVQDPERYLGRSLDAWVTEWGVPTCDPSSSQAHFTCVSRDIQAAYHARALIVGLSRGVKVWAPYELADEGQAASDAEQNFGLTETAAHNFTPKPAFYALQRIASILGQDWRYEPNAGATLELCSGPEDCKPITLSSSTRGPQMLWFRANGETICFLWKAGGYDNASVLARLSHLKIVQPPAKVRLTDVITGEVLTVDQTSNNGLLTIGNINIGSRPVALEMLGQ